MACSRCPCTTRRWRAADTAWWKCLACSGSRVKQVVTRQCTSIRLRRRKLACNGVRPSAAHHLLGRRERFDVGWTREDALGILHQRGGGLRQLDAVVIQAPEQRG